MSDPQFKSPRVRHRLPLRAVLMVAFLTQSIAAVGLTGWLSFHNGQRAVHNIANQLLDEVSINIQQHLENYLATPGHINAITTDLITNNMLDSRNLAAVGQLLWREHQWFNSVNLIAVGLENGNYVEVLRGQDGTEKLNLLDRSQSPKVRSFALDDEGKSGRLLQELSDYDPRERPWYTASIDTGKAIWNDIYITQFDHQLVIAMSQPIYDANHHLVGVATVNTGLFQINQFLRRLKIGKTGQTFIVEPDGMLIASSTSEEPYLPPRGDRQPERIRAANSWNLLVRGTAQYLDDNFDEDLSQVAQQEHLDFELGGMRHFARVIPFRDPRGLNWYIVIVVPEADFTAQIDANTRLTVALCLIALTFAAGIGIVTSKWLVNPILKVAQAAQALSEGNWQQQVPEFASRELGLLAHTFNQMSAQLQQSFETLKETEAKYRDIFENTIEGIYQSTPEGRYLSVNPALAQMYGYSDCETLIREVRSIADQVYVNPKRRSEFIQLLEENETISGFESQVHRADGSAFWISENARAKRDDQGNVLYYEGTVEDITLRRQIEDQLAYSASHDSLTGLLNRSAFLDHLQRVIARNRRGTSHLFAVLFLDLDDFKRVNDSLGHLVGDRLLIAFVRRIVTQCLRIPDVIARFGGDEFIILIDRLANPEEAIQVAQKISTALRQPFRLQEDEVLISTSIGIVLSTISEQMQAEDFLRDADIALYQAKLKGKGCYQLFDSTMHFQVMERLQLENDIRHGLDSDQFMVYYQPIFHLSSYQIVGFEALARWNHPTRGFLFPSKFISVAEETGLILPLSQQLMETACTQLKQWQQQGLVSKRTTMSVNVAGRQFLQNDFVSQIQTLLKTVRLPAHNLRLEITEGILMEHERTVIDTLTKLRQVGVDVAIDDFGIGYSSLSRLQNLPVDTLKLDRAFIEKMSESPEHEQFVKAIIHLGKTLNVTIVAEGIETEWQKEKLKSFGCPYGQGFWFSKPLDHEAILQLPAFSGAASVQIQQVLT